MLGRQSDGSVDHAPLEGGAAEPPTLTMGEEAEATDPNHSGQRDKGVEPRGVDFNRLVTVGWEWWDGGWRR